MTKTASLGALLFVLIAAGCVSRRPYPEKTDRVQVLGLEETRRQLEAVMKKATLPRVGTVEFSERAMRFRHVVIGPFDQPMHHGVWSTVDLDGFTRVDVYENNRAFIYVYGKEMVWLQFATPIDAEQFDDLLTSLAAAVKASAPSRK